MSQPDRLRVSAMRANLHDMADDLVGVRMRTAAGARGGAIERAREHLRLAQEELSHVMSGRLDGDAEYYRVISAAKAGAL